MEPPLPNRQPPCALLSITLQALLRRFGLRHLLCRRTELVTAQNAHIAAVWMYVVQVRAYEMRLLRLRLPSCQPMTAMLLFRLLDSSKVGTAAYNTGLATQQAAGNASLAAQAISKGNATSAARYVENSKNAAAQAGMSAGQNPQG